MASRITQVPVEVVYSGDPGARVSQVPVEVVYSGNPAARVSQIAVEVIFDATPAPVASFAEDPISASDAFDSGTVPLVIAAFSDSLNALDSMQVSVLGYRSAVFEDIAQALDAVSLGSLGSRSAVFADRLNAFNGQGSMPLTDFAADLLKIGTINGANPVLTFRLFLDDSTRNFSNVGIQHPTRTYEGRVMRFGTVSRSIPEPSGILQIGDAKVQLADTDRLVRGFMGIKTPLRRLCEIKLGYEGESESTFQICYIGEIVDASFGPGTADLGLTDIHSRWIDELIPKLGTLDSFPNQPVGQTEFFANIIFGRHLSAGIILDDEEEPADPGECDPGDVELVIPPVLTEESENIAQGRFNLPLADTSLKRYCVAAHPCESVPTVYRKTSDATAYAFVLESEYTIVEDPITIKGIVYDFTYVQFAAAQASDTLIRADVLGANFRGQFGPMGEVGYSRNPVDAIVNLVYFGVIFTGSLLDPVAERYDYLAYQEVWDKCDTLGYLCDFSITESITFRSALAQLCSSFGIDFLQNKSAKLSLGLTVESDPLRQVLGDAFHILRESESQTLAKPTYNRIRYSFGLNKATNQWAQEKVWDNTVDQTALKKVTEILMALHAVEESTVALDVIEDRGGYYDLGAYVFECDLPAPLVITKLELGELVGITHYAGIGGAYENVEFKIMSITLDLDALKFRIRAIRRIQFTHPGATLSGEWTHNSRVGPHQGLGTEEWYGVFRDPANFKKIIVKKRTGDGAFMPVGASAMVQLTNIIGSHDSHPFGQYIHIAVQEYVTGRVSYWRLDMATDTFDIINSEVKASNDIGSGLGTVVCSVAVIETSGKVVIAYDSDRETVGGVIRQRAAFKVME